MRIRRSSIVLVVVGVILVVLAGVTRFVVAPGVSKLPTSLDVTNTYTGTGTLLNAEAVQAGDMQNAVATDVPVEVVRHTYVSSSEGNTAIVHDDFTVKAPNGVELPTNHTYAVDRTSMEEAAPPAGQEVEQHRGLTIGLPIGPDPDRDYELYDFATQGTYPMTKTDVTTVADREVLSYTVAAHGPLEDTAILDGLPPALPKNQIAQIATLLPPSTQSRVLAALPTLPAMVPVNYTADSTIGLSVDSTLGTPVAGTLKQQVIANINVSGEGVPLMPVLALDTTLNSESVNAAVDSAASTTTLLNVIKLWAPLVLLILGIVLIVWGLLRRKTPSQATTTS